MPNQTVAVQPQQQQQQQQPQPGVPLSIPSTVTVSQPVNSSQPVLKTIPQSQHVIINSSLPNSGGNTQISQAQVIQNVTAVRPQKTLPVPVQVQIPQQVVQNNTAQPQTIQNTAAQPQTTQNTPVQIVRENEQDGSTNSSVSQQQEKANKIIAEAIAKAQRSGAVSAMPRVLSPPELPATLADVDNPDAAQEEKPVKPKKKRRPRGDSKKEKTPKKRRKKEVKVEATDETTNVDVENMTEEVEEVKEKKVKKKKEHGDEKKPKMEIPAKFLSKKRKK